MSEIKTDDAATLTHDAAPPTADHYCVDGYELSEQRMSPDIFYRFWRSEAKLPDEERKAVILLHRGHEHGGRISHLVGEVAGKDADYFAWDARGHGRSGGRRGFADSFAQMVQDLDAFVHHIVETHHYLLKNVVVVANSVASVVASTWLHDYAPQIRAMVLVAPAFRVKLYVPFALTGLNLLDKVKADAVIKSYVKPMMLTSDKQMADDYAHDPLISRDISNRILVQMYDNAARVVDDAAAIHTPIMLLSAGKDAVVSNRPQETFFERISSSVKVRKHYPDFKHAILHEKDRSRAIADIYEFINARFAEPLTDASAKLIAGDPASRIKAESLTHLLSIANPKRWYWAMGKLNLRIGGFLSEGIRIGYLYGFDSGQSLDHVYINKAKGRFGVGRLIDRFYIDSVGWQGIRQRKVHLKQLLSLAVAHAVDLQEKAAGESDRAEGAAARPVRIVDVASGPGRYMLEFLGDHDPDGVPRPAAAVDARCRDFSETGVEAGRKLAKEMGIENVRYDVGDAFDYEQLASLTPKPDIVVVSGLYELFDDNEMILRSLRGICEALPEGGCLVYTNQPWHPQQEMIARMLPNRDGEPWVMRCRSQLEMDTLVREAGFEKRNTLIDRWGIFSVSWAAKVGDRLRAK